MGARLCLSLSNTPWHSTCCGLSQPCSPWAATDVIPLLRHRAHQQESNNLCECRNKLVRHVSTFCSVPGPTRWICLQGKNLPVGYNQTLQATRRESLLFDPSAKSPSEINSSQKINARSQTSEQASNKLFVLTAAASAHKNTHLLGDLSFQRM